jgi:23S rRNA-/tRNA-specific pseudouridylate synthase
LTAVTDFRVLKRFADGTSLLEVFPRTGRTNQIRIHLWSLNYPLCGDLTYTSGGQIGETQTLPIDAPPLCLLAQQIAFTHPLTKERMVFQTELPDWCHVENR